MRRYRAYDLISDKEEQRSMEMVDDCNEYLESAEDCLSEMLRYFSEIGAWSGAKRSIKDAMGAVYRAKTELDKIEIG